MALLETELYPNKSTDPFISHGYKDLYSMVSAGETTSYLDYNVFSSSFEEEEEEEAAKLAFLGVVGLQEGKNNWKASSQSVVQNVRDWDPNYSSPEAHDHHHQIVSPNAQLAQQTKTANRRKRRRTKTSKNQKEIENQRMTHIAVERNRRKQMNDYLSILRSLMPASYVQRGDQASIIGGAINFVKELEQLLQSMEGQKKTNYKQQDKDSQSSSSSSSNSISSSRSAFADFFTYPQYSTRATQCNNSGHDSIAQDNWAVADIEVTMVDSHVNVKILSNKKSRQLLNMVIGFQSLLLSVLHLNVTTLDQMVLYTVSVKIEEGCQLHTADEIAAAVNQMFRSIREEQQAFS